MNEKFQLDFLFWNILLNLVDHHTNIGDNDDECEDDDGHAEQEQHAEVRQDGQNYQQHDGHPK